MWPWKSNSHHPDFKYASDLPYKYSHPNHPPHPGTHVSLRLLHMVIACLVFGVLLLFINVYQLRSINSGVGIDGNARRRIAWINAAFLAEVSLSITETLGKQDNTGSNTHMNKIQSGYLNHVIAVLEQTGFIVMETDIGNWDLQWSHEYPFGKSSGSLKDLETYQKVNHFPGSGFITNKASLATSHFQFCPPAFEIPRDKLKFLEKVRKNPATLWVEKSNHHRGIHIKPPAEINVNKESNNAFVQEFIDDPLLIDGRKFDIGVYVVLTSIDPLRVYVHEEEVLIRFCTKDYHPLNKDDETKYVVGDEYTQPWELPSLKQMWTVGMNSRKMQLSTYLRQQGKDDVKMWKDINKAISEVYVSKEPDLISSSLGYRSTRNFFELVRFDFILDKKMRVWLMEVNMSPNLSSASHGENKLMYEQVVFNLLGLVGAASTIHHSMRHSSTSIKELLVSEHNIRVSSYDCASTQCRQSCLAQVCRLCHPCLKESDRAFLKQAFSEHINRGSYRRVYPPPMTQEEARKGQNQIDQNTNPSNQLMSGWFQAMCVKDAVWCS